jgi:hypothetical protein
MATHDESAIPAKGKATLVRLSNTHLTVSDPAEDISSGGSHRQCRVLQENQAHSRPVRYKVIITMNNHQLGAEDPQSH